MHEILFNEPVRQVAEHSEVATEADDARRLKLGRVLQQPVVRIEEQLFEAGEGFLRPQGDREVVRQLPPPFKRRKGNGFHGRQRLAA